MNSFNQGNSQGGTQEPSPAAPNGSRQSGEPDGAQIDAGQDLGIAAEELAFGEVRRVERIRQRQGGAEGQNQQ
jgi:hypothetical protein